MGCASSAARLLPCALLLSGFTETSTTGAMDLGAGSAEGVDVIELEPEPDVIDIQREGTRKESSFLPPGSAEGSKAGTEEDGRGTFEPSVRASVRLDARISIDTRFDQKGEHVVELGLGGRLELDVDIANDLSAFTAPSFFYVSAVTRDFSDREVVYVSVPETRLSWSFGPFDLRVGALVFNWGASDLIGPSDVLNPFDYRRNFVAAIDDAKIPVLAAELVLSHGPLTVRGVVEPFFTPSRFFLIGWDTSLLQSSLGRGLDAPALETVLGQPTLDDIGDRLLITRRPQDRLDNATFAARATLTFDDLDLSLTAVHGWEPIPRISAHPDLVIITSILADSVAKNRPIDTSDPRLFAALGRLQDVLQRGQGVFEGRYTRRDVLGFDGVLAVDPLIFKIDVAYTFHRTAYTHEFRPVAHPWLLAVAGVEYFEGDDLQIIVEGFALTILDVKSSYRLLLIEANTPPPSTTDAGQRTLAVPGIAGIVRYSMFEGDLRFELGGIASLSRGDLLMMPSVTYRLEEAQQIALGALLIEGRADGYGGAYSHNDFVFLQYQWTH